MSVLQLSQHFSTQHQPLQLQQSVSKLPKVLQQIPKMATSSPPPLRIAMATEDKNLVRRSSSSILRRHSSNSIKAETLRPVIRASVDSNYSPTSKDSQEDIFQQEQDTAKALPNISEDTIKHVTPVVEQSLEHQRQINGNGDVEEQEPQRIQNHHKKDPQELPKESKVETQKVEPPTFPGIQLTIGLEALQEQVRRRALRKGFTLNLMVIGRSGLGKTTFINTLFQTRLMQKPQGSCDQKTPKTTEIRTTKRLIEEKGVKLHLSVTDTPGFGDMVDNSNCWEPAMQYVEEQYSKYLKAEKATDRPRSIDDTRVHCCLYFIPPTGHGLRPLDIEVLSRLHKVTNVIPVVAKADTLTIEERKDFKKLIQEGLLKNGIEVYPMRRYEDVEDHQTNEIIRKMTPFAVAGSEQIHEVNGRKVLGRKHLWGIVEVENPNHCEFHHLRNLLIRTHMQDLVELTSAVHYESFRRQKLDQAQSFNSFDISTLSALDESHI